MHTTHHHPAAADPIAASIRTARDRAGIALIPYLTAGFPTKASLVDQLRRLADAGAAAIEVGVPFSDPMADGVTIQRSSRAALDQGVTLGWIFDTLASLKGQLSAPLLLMSYLNPLLTAAQRGHTLGAACAAAGVSGLIIPDLPLEETTALRADLDAHPPLALVQLVSPVTPDPRARQIAAASRGFLYAVTVTGVTGSSSSNTHAGSTTASTPTPAPATALHTYLDALRTHSPVPVCAGFGVRSREHVAALRTHADGAIVGSALIEAIEAGLDPGTFLRSLQP